jgi:hypothetical protein
MLYWQFLQVASTQLSVSVQAGRLPPGVETRLLATLLVSRLPLVARMLYLELEVDAESLRVIATLVLVVAHWMESQQVVATMVLVT